MRSDPRVGKRELITGLLPFNENKQHFEILNTEGPKIQYLYLWHWQDHTWTFCNKS